MRVARVWYALEQLAHLDPRLEASAAPAPAAAHKPKPIAPRKGGAVGAAVAAAAAEQPAAAGMIAVDVRPQMALVVLDAPNIAMRHGKKKLFSCKGIQLAMEWYQVLHHAGCWV